jgi:hypothetical protein
MALYNLSSSGMSPVKGVSFSEVGVRERADLQRVLREKIHIVVSDVLIIAEEFSDWEDSRRRIDLLGLDRSGSLVVFELKRTADGGHMELQAVRYAAMVSALTFERLVEIYGDFLTAQGKELDPVRSILDHLGLDSAEDGEIAGQVRIILVSADFSREITTTVLWLNEQGLDITCVRLAAYDLDGKTLVDVQQVIPLPEAGDYTVKMKEKRREARVSRCKERDLSKYRVVCGDEVHPILNKRRAIFSVVFYLSGLGVSPEQMSRTINQKRQRFFSVDGIFDSELEFLAAAAEKAATSGESFDSVRWFTSDEDLIRQEGKTYAFSNQWGSQTENKLSDLINTHGGGKVSFEKVS